MTLQEAKAAMHSTDNGLVSLQVIIYDESKRIADIERTLAEMRQDHPSRPVIEDQLKLERQRQQISQTSLEMLVKARAGLQETIEKAGG